MTDNFLFLYILFPIKIDPTKYFGCELGTQVKCDDKNEKYIVNGEHDAQKLQSILDGFISKFVLCDSCQNPETDIVSRLIYIHIYIYIFVILSYFSFFFIYNHLIYFILFI